MIGNEKYGDYVPDKVSPNLLSRDFLLSVRYYFKYFQLIAFVDADLYKKLQSIEKDQLSKKNYNKWEEYRVKLNKEIYDKLQNFVPIDK